MKKDYVCARENERQREREREGREIERQNDFSCLIAVNLEDISIAYLKYSC